MTTTHPARTTRTSPVRSLVAVHVRCSTAIDERIDELMQPRRHDAGTSRRDRGQATTEYALVMLGAAAIALLVITWATSGGGAGRIGRLFDRVIDAVLDKV